MKLLMSVPKMYVRATEWGINADRVTDRIDSRGYVQHPEFGRFEFTYTWPECLVWKPLGKDQDDPVRYNVEGQFRAAGIQADRIVEAFHGYGTFDAGGAIMIAWPPEPCRRQGRFMYALPIDSTNGYATVLGMELPAKASLLKVRGVPQFPFGLFSYLMDATIVSGDVG